MTLLAEIPAKPFVFLLLLIIVIGWLMFRLMRRTNQKDSLKTTPRMTNTARNLGASPPPELDRWSVEMQELARDTLATIDTKMRALDYLTTQATAAAQRLEAAIANENPMSESPSDLGQSAPPVSPATLSLVTPESLDTHNQADVLERATGRTHHSDAYKGDAYEGDAYAGDAHESDAPNEPTGADTESRRRLIYEMADRGTDLAAIAAAVGSPMGEIELILGLRQQET